VFQDRADEYRAWAAQCHAMAARAKSDEDKSPWLELAEKWQRLAVQVANSPSSQQVEQPQRTQDTNWDTNRQRQEHSGH
jgi:hypothetical protein